MAGMGMVVWVGLQAGSPTGFLLLEGLGSI